MSAEDTEFNEQYFDLMAGGMAVMNVVLFALVGQFALESLTYGAIAGLFAGFGTYLFIPWFLRFQTVTEATEEDLGLSELARRVDRSSQLGVLGIGLELGSIVMLLVAFSLEEADLVLGTGVAVAVALVIYLVGIVLLDG